MRKLILLLALSTAACVRSEAAQISNAKFVEKSVAGSSLQAGIQPIIAATPDIAWIAYDVAVNEPNARMCCFSSVEEGQKTNWQGGGCSLDRDASFVTNHGEKPNAEAVQRDSFTVLLRIQNRQIDRVRMFSADCPVDAVGLRIYRLASVDPADSVRYLTSLMDSLSAPAGPKKKKDERSRAIAAIAMHRAPNAVSSISSIVRSNRDDDVRGHAAFWLGMKGGDEGRSVLRNLLDESEGSDHLKNQAVAGIAQDETRGAVDTLLELAKRHRDAKVRKHAIFWLGQKAGDKVIADLRSAADDPEDEVREMAVFAISQLPKEKAVSELIELVRTHRSGKVRQKALFWLGQSNDPRALELIEQIVTR